MEQGAHIVSRLGALNHDHDLGLVGRGAYQNPATVIEGHAHAIDRDHVLDLATENFAACRRKVLVLADDRLDHAIFYLIAAMGRHGQGGEGHWQGLFQVRQFLARITIQHGQDRRRRRQAAVIAAPQIAGEKEVAGLFKARQGLQLSGLALDIAMACLPIDRRTAIGREHRIGGIEARRLHIDNEGGPRIERGKIAGQHQADLVGIDLFTLIINDAAAVTIPIKAKGQIGAVRAHRLGHGHQHDMVFGIGVIFRETVVEITVHLDHLNPHRPQGLRREGTGRAIPAGGNDFKRTLDLNPRRRVGDEPLSDALNLGQ